MRIRDWSSDVCSSDLLGGSLSARRTVPAPSWRVGFISARRGGETRIALRPCDHGAGTSGGSSGRALFQHRRIKIERARRDQFERSEEHTSELQSLMRNSYAVFCLKKKKQK